MHGKLSSAILLALLLTVLYAGTLNIQPTRAGAVDWWPMFQHDLTHTGYSTSTGPTTNATLWICSPGMGSASSPAVVDGVVYVVLEDYNACALDALTGKFMWNYTLSGDIVYSSPAVAGGIVYVSSQDSYVYALNASTGTLVWKYQTGSWVTSSPAVAGGIVYVGSWDDNVYALNSSTGTLIWKYKTGNMVQSSPAVAGGVVYVGSSDKNVYALNTLTGALVWNYTTGNVVASSPAVAGGIVYVGSDDNKTYALDASTGTLVWNYTTGNYVESSPAVVNGIVYIGSDDDYVYALDAPTGALVWKYKTSYWITLSFAIADGVLYVPNESGDLYAFGDKTPPKTYLTIGNPKYVDSTGNLYVASFTLFALTAMDNVGGSGVQSTAYRIYNASYNTGWLLYTAPFSLAGLRDGSYSVDYNSTDKAGNVETTSTQNVILNSKATMIGYAKNEIQALINQVHGSMIFQWFKDYLEINVLKYALKQDGMAFDFAVKGDVTSANSALKGCKGTMAGFISSVMNLKAFGLIPAATANIWIATAQTIINDLNTAIATP